MVIKFMDGTQSEVDNDKVNQLIGGVDYIHLVDASGNMIKTISKFNLVEIDYGEDFPLTKVK